MTIHSAIQDAIKKCNLVFFIGSGFSRPLGLPNWTELVKIITDDLKRDYPNDAFITTIVDQIRQGYFTEIEALDKLKTKHRERIVTILKKNINIGLALEGLGRHEKLWQITDQIVTTNYDKAFETVLPERIEKVVYEDDFHVAKLSATERFLYKAHGCIEYPGKCILFSEQYEKLYNGQTGAALELFKILSDKTIIFLGFSLNDPFVNKLLELRQKAYKGFKANNFIITTDNKDFSVFGVEKINGVTNYGEDLDLFLDELMAIREKYPYGFGMLLKGLIKEGKDFNEEVVRKKYLEFIATMELKPETAAVAEEIKAGKFENAEDKLKAELEEELQSINEGKEKAAVKAFELANLKIIQLKYKEALQYYQQAVELQPENSLYCNGLGYLLSDLGQFKPALEYYKKALTIDLEIYGETHYEIAACYNNIGDVLFRLDVNKEANEYFKKALAINLKINGENHSSIAILYNNIGAICSNLGKNRKALEYYQKALNIDLQIYGEKHSSIATRYGNIAVILNNLKEYKKAMDFHQKALKIDLKVYGKKHPAIAIDYSNIGATWSNHREYKKAMQYYKKSIGIDLEIYGEKHPAVAIRYYNMGTLWVSLKEYKKAIKCYQKALDIEIEIYETKHSRVAKSNMNIGIAYERNREYNKAIEHYEKALVIFSETLGEKHSETKRVARNLRLCYAKLNNSDL